MQSKDGEMSFSGKMGSLLYWTSGKGVENIQSSHYEKGGKLARANPGDGSPSEGTDIHF